MEAVAVAVVAAVAVAAAAVAVAVEVFSVHNNQCTYLCTEQGRQKT